MISPHVQVRRLFAAPDNNNEVLASTNNGLLLPFVYQSKNKTESHCLEWCKCERLHLCETSVHNPYIQLPYPVIDLAWCPFKNKRENSAVMIACRSQPLQLWDVCFDDDNDSINNTSECNSTTNYEEKNETCNSDDDDDDDDDSISDRNELRASYLAFNDSNAHVYPHAVCWFTSNNSSKSSFVAAGYGDFEDKTCIRIFDVCVEGNSAVWSYTSPRVKLLPSHQTRARRLVSCLATGPAPVECNLLMCGYYNHDAVELVDTRHHTQATLLYGLASCGIGCLRTLPELPYCVFAMGRGNNGDKRSGDIVCWDIRKATCVLARLERNSLTTELCEMSFVQGTPSIHEEEQQQHEKHHLNKVVNLVATSSYTNTSEGHTNTCNGNDGGVLVYKDIVKTIKSGNIINNNSRYYSEKVIHGERYCSQLGSTSGLCGISHSHVAVVTGSRSYTFSHLHDKVGKLQEGDASSESDEDEVYKRRKIEDFSCSLSSSSSDESSDYNENKDTSTIKKEVKWEANIAVCTLEKRERINK